MIYEMNVKLNEQQYAALLAEAAKSGKQPETVLDEIMTEHFQQQEKHPHENMTGHVQQQEKHPMTGREFMEKLLREGKISHIPTRRPLTPEEKAERERLGRLFSEGKPMSEMVIEDRGPY